MRLPLPKNYHRPLGTVISDDGTVCEAAWFEQNGSQTSHTIASNKVMPRGTLTANYTAAVLENQPQPIMGS